MKGVGFALFGGFCIGALAWIGGGWWLVAAAIGVFVALALWPAD